MSRRRPVRHWLAAAAAIAAIGLAGCGTPIPTASPSPAASGPTESTGPPEQTLATATAAPPSSAPSGGVLVDPGLLEVLPAEVDGVALVADPDTAAAVAADPEVAEVATSIAVALAIRPGASSDADDIAVASIVRLKPDVFDDEFYAEWRSDYDAAACEPAGGVAGSGDVDSDGVPVIRTACVGGTSTYHAWLEAQGFIVSVTSTGPGDLGGLIMAGLAN